MEWLVWMVAVAILGLAAVAASGRLGEFPATVTDTPQPHVPAGTLSGADLRALRFAVVPRGYSMQQVDELLDRISRQLDADPAEDEPAVDEPTQPSWHAPSRTWADDPGLEPTGEVEPQPPLGEEHDVPPLRAEEPPATPSWQAAEVVYAVADEPSRAIEDEAAAEVEPVDSAQQDADFADIFVAESAEDTEGGSSATLADDQSMTEAEPAEPMESEVDRVEDPVTDAAAVLAEEPIGQVDDAVRVEPATAPAELDADADAPDAQGQPEPVSPDVPPVAPAKHKAKREPKSKATAEAVVASAADGTEAADRPTAPADDLEAEIERLGTEQTVVADYGAALDDLVSKYSFRKVEHWYELPGFDIPAPVEPVAEPEQKDEPGQDSTPADL
jgi:DivIVA domain-containing protein